MDPKSLVPDNEYLKKSEELTNEILAYRTESIAYREQALEPRWARSMRLIKGIPIEEESMHSKVRGKNKIYFRKVWSSCTRLLASFYQAFLKDKNKFKILGRDDVSDPEKAKVLEIMTKYRLDFIFRRRDGFKKLLWALFNCIAPGFSVVKMYWKYNKEMGIDEPDFCVYQPERVCLDWSNLENGTLQEMRYAMFDNWMTKDQMEEQGYSNITKIIPGSEPQSEVQQVRYSDSKAPVGSQASTDGLNYSQGTVGNNYPSVGKEENQRKSYLNKYLCTEVYWKKKGKIYFCVINPESGIFLIDPMMSPYGREYPIAVGSMLIDPHKPVAESITESCEGPQESLNQTINMRFDNVALAMNSGFIYSRFAGVDKQSLRNIHPGFTVAANDINGIRDLRTQDVTQSSYVEAGQFVGMIDEETGVNPTKQGNSDVSKATVASINLTEANAKHDLFIATVSQSLFQQFIYMLARFISMFETDERVFRVANAELRKQQGGSDKKSDIYDIEFDFDLELDVGASEVSRGVQIQRMTVLLDKMLQSNNSTFMMMKAGIQVQNPKIWNVAELTADLAPELNMPNLSKYLVQVAPPPTPEPGKENPAGNRDVQSAAGAQAPQGGEELDPAFIQNLMQGMGG